MQTSKELLQLSEGCLSEASSSGLQKRISQDESQEDCPKCAAMRLNAVVAEEALASLSGQFKNLQKELKVSFFSSIKVLEKLGPNNMIMM